MRYTSTIIGPNPTDRIHYADIITSSVEPRGPKSSMCHHMAGILFFRSKASRLREQID